MYFPKKKIKKKRVTKQLRVFEFKKNKKQNKIKKKRKEGPRSNRIQIENILFKQGRRDLDKKNVRIEILKKQQFKQNNNFLKIKGEIKEVEIQDLMKKSIVQFYVGVKDIFLLNYPQVLFVFEFLYKNKKGKLLKIRQ